MANGKDGPKRIAIACQGGGSHTAFTAGALRRILEKVQDEEVQDKRSYDIVALSGTSGGAVCAFLAWYALLEKNNESAAMKALRSFWVEDNAAYLRVGDLDSVWGVLANDVLSASTLLRRFGETALGVGFNPELNPYRYHQLFDFWRRRLKESIERNVRQISPKANDIDRAIEERVRPPSQDVQLFIGAVNTLTGDFKVFKSHKRGGENLRFNDDAEDRVSVDAVLASAAIPTVFEATHTGEAVYWVPWDPNSDPSCPPGERTCVDEGVYWDGLYSQNPPVRDLTEADPHEIWVIQINPEEIGREPKKTAEIEDRRNELSGNTSLNQELYFIRKINELVKRAGCWECDYDGILRKVFRIRPPAGSEKAEKKYATIKVRRIELSMSLDVSSKLDRSRPHIKKLMKHGAEQAKHFLQVISSQIAFEAAWDKALRNKENVENVDAVMDFFVARPVIELMPPWDPSSSQTSRDEGWKTDGPEKVRAVLDWCLAHNLTIEQSRDYWVREDPPNRRVITCWILATADNLEDPIKGQAKVVVLNGKVERLTFFPLSSKVTRDLMKQMKNLVSGSRGR